MSLETELSCGVQILWLRMFFCALLCGADPSASPDAPSEEDEGKGKNGEEALGGERAWGLVRAITAAVCIVLALYAKLTCAQAHVWSTSKLLWTHAYNVNPGSSMVKHWYTLELVNSGRPAEAVQVIEAAFRENPKISLPQPDWHFMYGQALVNLGDCVKAKPVLRRSLDVMKSRLDESMARTEKAVAEEQIGFAIPRDGDHRHISCYLASLLAQVRLTPVPVER